MSRCAFGSRIYSEQDKAVLRDRLAAGRIEPLAPSVPRPTAQSGVDDRDKHAGQQHVPLAQLEL